MILHLAPLVFERIVIHYEGVIGGCVDGCGVSLVGVQVTQSLHCLTGFPCVSLKLLLNCLAAVLRRGQVTSENENKSPEVVIPGFTTEYCT